MHDLRQQARAMPGRPGRTGAAMVADGFTPSQGGDLVIVGAGGFGRETAQAVHAINQHGGSWRLLGFLDDDPTRADRKSTRLNSSHMSISYAVFCLKKKKKKKNMHITQRVN